MRVLLFIILFLFPVQLFAYVPTFINPQTVNDRPTVTQEGVLYSFFGELRSFPHAFEIPLAKQSRVFIQIAVPDTAEAAQDKSLIIVKREKRGVSEVARIPFQDMQWTPIRDRSTGDTYLLGGSFEQQLEPGVYIVEVSTIENTGKYVLLVEKGVQSGVQPRRGYLRTLADTYAVKRFFNKSPVAVLQSPFYYIPVLLFLFGLVGHLFYRKKGYA